MLNHFYDHASHGAVFFAALFPVMHHPTAHHVRLFNAHDLADDEGSAQPWPSGHGRWYR